MAERTTDSNRSLQEGYDDIEADLLQQYEEMISRRDNNSVTTEADGVVLVDNEEQDADR